MFASMYALYRIEKSRIGDSFKAIYADPLLAEAIGIRVPPIQTPGLRHRWLHCRHHRWPSGSPPRHSGPEAVRHHHPAIPPRVGGGGRLPYLLGSRNRGVCDASRFRTHTPANADKAGVLLPFHDISPGLYARGESLIPRAIARWRRLRGVPTAETG